MGSDEEEPEAIAFLDVGEFPVVGVLEGRRCRRCHPLQNSRERVPDDANSQKAKIYPRGYKAH